MAIASGGTLGTAADSAAASSFTLTTATNSLASGDHAILEVVTDNRSTSDGQTNDHTSVTGGTGVWTKLGEYTNSPGGAAGDGVTVSTWRFRATGTNGTGTVFTINLSGNATDKAASAWKFTVGAGNTLEQTTSAALITSEVNAANGFGSSAFSSLPSLSRLYLRAGGKEANSTTGLTVSTNFTEITGTRSRNNANAVIVRGEFRINTSTGETSNPTLAVTGDTAGLFFALEEVAISSSGTLSSTLGALVTSATTGTVLVAGVLAVTLAALTLPGATTHASDTFTDTSGTAIASHTPDVGTSWASGSSGITVESNRARGPLAGDGRATCTGTAIPSADYDVSCDVIGNGASSDAYKAGVRGRDAGGFLGECYEAFYDKANNRWELGKWTGFSYTQLGTYAETWTTGTKRLILRMAGTSIKVLIDNTERISVTDSSVSSTGKGGLYINGAGNRSAFEVDNFTVTSGTAAGTGTVTGLGGVAGTLASTLGACGVLACGLTATETAGWAEVTPGDYDPDAGSTDNFGFNGHVVRHPIAEHVFYATADYNGLWRSYDFGRTWTKISTTGGSVNIANGKTWFLAIAPDGSELVIGQGNNIGAGEYKKTIKSKGNLLDLGVVWNAASADLGFEPYGMDYDPADKTRIVATAHENDNCYVSTDGGVTFSSIGAIGSTSGAANYAYWGVSTNTIIAIVDGDTATGNGIRRATFSAGSWSSFSYVQEGRHQHGSHQLTVDRVNSQIVCPTALGYYLSTDDGATWTQVSSTPGSSAIPTVTKIYGGNSYATRGTLSGGPQLQDAPYPAATSWTSRSDPSGLTTNGPVRGTSSSDGLKSSVVTANWREGLWRYVEPTPLAGSLNSTLGALTATSTGTVAVAGATSATLGAATSAATGTVAVGGATNATLGAVTASSTGTVLVSGTSAVTLGAATLAGTGSVGSVPINGSLSSTLSAVTASSTGTVQVAGATAATLGAVTVAASGGVTVSGATAATLGAATLTGTGTLGGVTNGTLAATLGTLTATSAGTVAISGVTSTTLGAVVSSASGGVEVKGAVASTLDALTSSIGEIGEPPAVMLQGIRATQVNLIGMRATHVALVGYRD